MPETTVEIFSDGACSGNPGPGGYGAILRWNGKEKELSGGEKHTTNNRMELTVQGDTYHRQQVCCGFGHKGLGERLETQRLEKIR